MTVATQRGRRPPGNGGAAAGCRACWGAVVILLVVLLLPYLLVPLYRVVNPVSTLMLWRWATGRPVERSFVPIERMAPALRSRSSPPRTAASAATAASTGRRSASGSTKSTTSARRAASRPSPSRPPRTCSCGRGAASCARRWSFRWRCGSTSCCRNGAARNLPQRRRMGAARAVRRRGREPLCLQQVGAADQRARGGPARRGAAESETSQRQQPGPAVRRLAGIYEARGAAQAALASCAKGPIIGATDRARSCNRGAGHAAPDPL